MNLHTNLDLTPNPAQKPEKTRQKVAETAKIRKKTANTRKKVAEITINPKTAKKK